MQWPKLATYQLLKASYIAACGIVLKCNLLHYAWTLCSCSCT